MNNNCLLASVNKVSFKGHDMLLDGGATHSATSSKNKIKYLQNSSISAIVDCRGNDNNVLCEGDYHDDNGSYLSGFLVSDGIACDITDMCEWLCQFDGSIEYFPVTTYFNPTCGDPTEHIVDQ